MTNPMMVADCARAADDSRVNYLEKSRRVFFSVFSFYQLSRKVKPAVPNFCFNGPTRFFPARIGITVQLRKSLGFRRSFPKKQQVFPHRSFSL